MAAPDRATALPISLLYGAAVHSSTRLSCRSFAPNAVRLQLHALAYNLGNFMRILVMPQAAKPRSLTMQNSMFIKLTVSGSNMEGSHLQMIREPQTGPKLSVVIPCYNEEAVIDEFYRRVTRACVPRNPNAHCPIAGAPAPA
jgi:hypothetical protein